MQRPTAFAPGRAITQRFAAARKELGILLFFPPSIKNAGYVVPTARAAVQRLGETSHHVLRLREAKYVHVTSIKGRKGWLSVLSHDIAHRTVCSPRVLSRTRPRPAYDKKLRPPRARKAYDTSPPTICEALVGDQGGEQHPERSGIGASTSGFKYTLIES